MTFQPQFMGYAEVVNQDNGFKNEFLNTIIFIYAKILFVRIHEDPFISIYGQR